MARSGVTKSDYTTGRGLRLRKDCGENTFTLRMVVSAPPMASRFQEKDIANMSLRPILSG
jgi:hypothetical protein